MDEVSLTDAISIPKQQGSGVPLVVIAIAIQQYRPPGCNLIDKEITRGKHLVMAADEKRAFS